MSFLLTSMNKANDAFKKAGSFDSDIGTFCGFTPIDVLSANVEHVNDLDVEILNGGQFNMPYTEIGLSASGKTTLRRMYRSMEKMVWTSFRFFILQC